MEEGDLTIQQFRNLLQDSLSVLQNSNPNLRKEDLETLASVIRNLHFFQTNLEPPANLHDFSQLVKHHINYEVHSQATALMKEGEIADKFYLILKGTVQKLQPRSFADLEEEIKDKGPRKRKKVKNQETDDVIEFRVSVKRDIPRYLQHTQATKKKTTTTKIESFHKTMEEVASAGSEAKIMGQIKKKPLKMNSAIEVLRSTRSGLSSRKQSGDVTLDEEQHQQEGPFSSKSFASQQKSGGSTTMKDENRSLSLILPKMNASNHPSIIEMAEQEEEREEKEEEDEEEEEEDQDEEEDEEKKKKAKTAKLNGMSVEDVEFIKKVATKNPEIYNRCFLGEIIRVKKDKLFKIGGHFGENFYKRVQPKEDYIMAVSSEEAHFLVITRASYQKVMAEISKQSEEKARFFLDLFPFYDEMIVKKFSYLFSEKDFKKNEIIFHQDEPATELYLLKSGDVRLFKEIDVSGQQADQNFSNMHLVNVKCPGKTGLPIATVLKHQFFGDEMLIKTERRKYTAAAIGTVASTYFLKTNVYHKEKGYYSDLLQILREHSKERFSHRELRVTEILDRKKAIPRQALGKQCSLDKLDKKSALQAQLGLRWGNTRTDRIRNSTPELKVRNTSPDDNRHKTDLSPNKSVIKTESVFPIPTLTIERTDFSHGAKAVDKVLEANYIKRRVEESMKEFNTFPPKYGLPDFSIARELQDKGNNRVRLPSLNSSRSPSPQKLRDTERTSYQKALETDMGPVSEQRKQPKRSQSIETISFASMYLHTRPKDRNQEERHKESALVTESQILVTEELVCEAKKQIFEIAGRSGMNEKIKRCVESIINENKVLKTKGQNSIKFAIKGKKQEIAQMNSSEGLRLSMLFGRKSDLLIRTDKRK